MVWVSPDGLGKAWLRISWKNLSWCSGKCADSTVRQTGFRDCLEFGSSFLTSASLSFRNCNINLTALFIRSGKVKFYKVFDSVSDNMLVIITAMNMLIIILLFIPLSRNEVRPLYVAAENNSEKSGLWRTSRSCGNTVIFLDVVLWKH